MKRLNLKQLKELLNKLPNEELNNFSITHYGATEDPECKFGLIFFTSEGEGSDEWDKCLGLLDDKNMKKIKKHFVDYLNKDFKIMRDEDGFDTKVENGNFEEADWEYDN